MIEKKIQYKEETNVILAGWLPQGQSEIVIKEYLDELAFLAETAGAKEVKRFYQRLPHPDSKTFLGSGKLEEIKDSPCHLEGFFECSGNQITSLIGGPKEVGGNYNCFFNKLTNLIGAPTIVENGQLINREVNGNKSSGVTIDDVKLICERMNYPKVDSLIDMFETNTSELLPEDIDMVVKKVFKS